MKIGVIDFIFWGFINRSNHQQKNVVNKVQEKQLWRSSFIKKNLRLK